MRMKDIYANATEVLMWMGKQDHLTGLAFDTFERFAADDATRGAATCRDTSDTAQERIAAIQLFLDRPYFDRV